LQFDKIHLYSKTGDNIKEMDADNTLSGDPVVKLLGVLKEIVFQSTLDSNGEVVILSGFKEISDKIIAAFPSTDPATRNALETELNKTIGEKLVKQNTSQLFQTFPDTPVHIGSTWKLTTKQQGDLTSMVDNLFTLKAINDNIAVIESHGTITTENATSNIGGLSNNVVSNLKGEQEGEYEIETKTGMLINSHVKSNITGTIQVKSRTIPIKIKSSVKMSGKKL
jgi:hypothetical protein